ncbi:3-hydroxy-9,10-secoandrosta-1,3,5(10)-triene-9,17-dione monooxygenase reductase subunit [Paractinoplanes toevensis]|uniref:Monooxygenase n=1 Tax=Paractinoplanes toevensis TaxID=571911 RepID=A0A919W2W8_9ACTN|nr:3-hydroxy-9,10-secoandrosta-1,3,5(10)-triene-9,17-dione monooxygenase reductase subunit [Actinoplanes toevensis]GIM92104.1 monooxygenase [Actinoplanes toevensis]
MDTEAPVAVDPAEFRRVFGHFCTGVTIVTTTDEDGPAGFACQAFAPLSLNPPLVLFCPQARSETWRRIRHTGLFCVNVLAEGHGEISRAFGARGDDRFAGVPWTPSPAGIPILTGVLTWAECRLEAVHPGGDHEIVVGRVLTLGECGTDGPLLFFRGRYRAAAPAPPGATPEVVDTLLAWPRHTDWI